MARQLNSELGMYHTWGDRGATRGRRTAMGRIPADSVDAVAGGRLNHRPGDYPELADARASGRQYGTQAGRQSASAPKPSLALRVYTIANQVMAVRSMLGIALMAVFMVGPMATDSDLSTASLRLVGVFLVMIAVNVLVFIAMGDLRKHRRWARYFAVAMESLWLSVDILVALGVGVTAIRQIAGGEALIVPSAYLFIRGTVRVVIIGWLLTRVQPA